jgi:hypothetical protein
MTVSGPNPQRVGACTECGAYRADGRPPYLHYEGCRLFGDPQLERFVAEMGTPAGHSGPVLAGYAVSCDEHGPMVRDDIRSAWYCPRRCGTWLPDEDVARLVAASRPDDDPVRIMVT